MKNEKKWSDRHLDKAKENINYHVESAVLDFVGLISQEMERQKISKAELARRLGKERSFISRVLNCNHNITLKTMIAISRELKIDLKIKAETKEERQGVWRVDFKSPAQKSLLVDSIEKYIQAYVRLTSQGSLSGTPTSYKEPTITNTAHLHFFCDMSGVCWTTEKEEFTDDDSSARLLS